MVYGSDVTKPFTENYEGKFIVGRARLSSWILTAFLYLLEQNLIFSEKSALSKRKLSTFSSLVGPTYCKSLVIRYYKLLYINTSVTV